MGRFQRSWELGKVSWRIVRSDRTLTVFPILGLVSALAALLVFGGLFAVTGIHDQGSSTAVRPVGWVFVALLYVVLAFVTTYFQSALVLAADRRLRGEDATVAEAIQGANARIGVILPWAILSATVSMVIRALEERSGLVGRIIGSFVGAAWGIVTFLAIPVLVLEGLGPINALKRSGKLLHSTWGENIAGQFGFGIVSLVASVPGILLLMVGISSHSVVPTVALGGIGVAWLVTVGVVISAMTGVYKTALYRYAVDHVTPDAYAALGLGDAFRPRRPR